MGMNKPVKAWNYSDPDEIGRLREQVRRMRAAIRRVRKCQRYTVVAQHYTTDNPAGMWMLATEVLITLRLKP